MIVRIHTQYIGQKFEKYRVECAHNGFLVHCMVDNE
jgi:hypothetical protein